ncbi:MAG: trypsin-like peptidase domain-containing protein [Deltaproteobacteria bacterium]|nr:trypsin-like peptidase domain-containing protein [Deltaproteobacteria bacterium]
MVARPRAPLLTVVSLAALGACGRADAPPPPAPATSAAPVVYGADDRLDWYALPTEEQRTFARGAIAAMISTHDLVPRDDGGFDLIVGESLGEAHRLCADQPYFHQPSVSICSGALVSDRLLLTAGHCVSSLADCAGYAWVFDYLYEGEGELADLGPDSVYRCVDIVTNGFRDRGGTHDFAIIQLDRAVVGRTPASVRAPGPVLMGGGLTVMGFPNGIPLKVADDGEVVAPRASAGDYFVGAVDAFYGNSGSAVFGEDGAIAGVLVDGADDYVDGGSCAKVLVLDPEDGEEGITYASNAVATLCEKGYPDVTLCGGEGVATCEDGWCTGDETSATCPADCDGLFAVPAAWTCNPAWYAAGDDCDCACGVYDPDCDDPELRVINCQRGSGCFADGTCELPVPATWTCPIGWYGEGDDCDCGCGAVDPDCGTADRVVGCARGSACLPDGTCEIPIAPGWTCPDRWYAADDDCDCDCGAPDPDCAAGLEVVGCMPGSGCQADGTCEESIPDMWICRRQYFAAGDECDCNCGAFDPDCQDPRNEVLNCEPDQLCGSGGECRDVGPVEPAPEPSPEPAPEPSPEPEPAAEIVEAGPEPAPEASVEAARGGERASGDGCAGGGGGPLGWLIVAALLRWITRTARARSGA